MAFEVIEAEIGRYIHGAPQCFEFECHQRGCQRRGFRVEPQDLVAANVYVPLCALSYARGMERSAAPESLRFAAERCDAVTWEEPLLQDPIAPIEGMRERLDGCRRNGIQIRRS